MNEQTVSNTPTILLVEDEALIAMAERVTIERYGYRVIIARSGEKAVDAVAGQPEIDLVLMDIDLGPGINGPDAAKAILADHDLPVVFLSSHTERSVVEQTEGITSYGYIVKNSGETVLLASIRMAFRLHDAVRARMESEARNRALLDANPDVMLLFGTDGTIVDYHAVEPPTLLVPPDRFLNRHVRDVVPPDLADTAERSIARVLSTGEPCIVDYDAYDQSGAHRFFEGRFVRGGSDSVLMISRNVTERKHHEDRARVLSEMLDAAPSVIVIYDLNGRFLYANRKALDTYGYTRDELLAMNLCDLKSPQSGAEIRDRIRLIERDGSAIFEAENRRSDGVAILMRVYAKRVAWGDLPAIMSISDDVTESARMADALKASEERYRAIFDHLPHGICYYDANGVCIDCNDAMSQIAGVDRSALIGFDMNTLDDESLRSILRRALAGEDVRFEGPIGAGLFADPKWIRSRNIPLYGAEGDLHVVAIVEDLTESRRLQRDLYLSKERLQIIAQNIDDVVVILDLDGVVTYATDSHLPLGYPPDEIDGIDGFLLVHPDERDAARRLLADAIRDHTPMAGTYRLRRYAGT